MRLLKAHRVSLALYEVFKEQWENPPPPFNPDFDPLAKQRYADVTKSMVEEGFYSTHTREECKEEWGKRYSELTPFPKLR